MTALAAARQRLETYVAEVVLQGKDLNPLQLRALEDEIVMAARCFDDTPF